MSDADEGVVGLRTLAEAINLVTETLSRKGEAYGPTYRRVGQALSVPPQYSILVRMFEKGMRLDNLLRGRFGPVQSTAVAEEFLDLACYAILGLLESSPSPSPSPRFNTGVEDEKIELM